MRLALLMGFTPRTSGRRSQLAALTLVDILGVLQQRHQHTRGFGSGPTDNLLQI
jgi:hypothetical protein